MTTKTASHSCVFCYPILSHPPPNLHSIPSPSLLVVTHTLPQADHHNTTEINTTPQDHRSRPSFHIMDMDCISQAAHSTTQFQKSVDIQHLCCHTCTVVHEFGNLFRCRSSGMLHVCDANCASRVYRDPYSSICILSKKLHGPLDQQASVGGR